MKHDFTPLVESLTSLKDEGRFNKLFIAQFFNSFYDTAVNKNSLVLSRPKVYKTTVEVKILQYMGDSADFLSIISQTEEFEELKKQGINIENITCEDKMYLHIEYTLCVP